MPTALTGLIGQKFDKVVVLYEGPRAYANRTFICRCECGKLTRKKVDQLLTPRRKRIQCRQCGYDATKKATPHVERWVWNNYKQGAKSRGLTFEITEIDLENLWATQRGLCALTGEPLVPLQKLKVKQNNKITFLFEGTASLDRIDSNQGYTIDNIQWVHKDINKMKWDFDQTAFVSWCRKVAKWKV